MSFAVSGAVSDAMSGAAPVQYQVQCLVYIGAALDAANATRVHSYSQFQL